MTLHQSSGKFNIRLLQVILSYMKRVPSYHQSLVKFVMYAGSSKFLCTQHVKSPFYTKYMYMWTQWQLLFLQYTKYSIIPFYHHWDQHNMLKSTFIIYTSKVTRVTPVGVIGTTCTSWPSLKSWLLSFPIFPLYIIFCLKCIRFCPSVFSWNIFQSVACWMLR